MKNKQKPSFIKKCFRFLIFSVLIFISCILIYLACAFIFSRITVNKQYEKNAIHTVYLMKSGIHVDFLLPISNELKDWQEDFPISNTLSKDGLWDNIRQKKDKEGKKYKPAKRGDKDRPDPKQWKKLTSGFISNPVVWDEKTDDFIDKTP
jgi:hypothetical protein